MNEPVPPAQIPFIRCSIVEPKYMIFASSPPSSMATSGLTGSDSMAVDTAITSWVKGIPRNSAMASPPEPVMEQAASISGYCFKASSVKSAKVS